MIQAKQREQQSPTAGRYLVLSTPADALEAFVRRVWDFAFHGIPFPEGWIVRWADLSQANALAMTVWNKRLLLFDEQLQRSRTTRDFVESVLHELSHLAHPMGEHHGPGFAETLKRLLEYVAPPGGLETPPPGSPFVAPPASGPRVRPEGSAAAHWMSPESWFQGAVVRQRIVNEKIAAEQAAGRAISAMRDSLKAKRRVRLTEERGEAEQREAKAIQRYAEASDAAIAWMARYRSGWQGSPHPTLDECAGRLLALAFPGGATVMAECARRDRLARERERASA
jgi:hypothetical protein